MAEKCLIVFENQLFQPPVFPQNKTNLAYSYDDSKGLSHTTLSLIGLLWYLYPHPDQSHT